MKKLYCHIKIELFRRIDEKEILKTAEGEKKKENYRWIKVKLTTDLSEMMQDKDVHAGVEVFASHFPWHCHREGLGHRIIASRGWVPCLACPLHFWKFMSPHIVSKFLCAIFPTVLFLN